MVRKLKYHEQKLLKKVDFVSWEIDNNVHEAQVMRKFHLKKRDEYASYNKLSRCVRDLAHKIAQLDMKDNFRIDCTKQLLHHLYEIGLVVTKDSLEQAVKVSASSFCRRRLPVIMKRNNMAESIKAATEFVEHGHVRVGPELVTDPAFLVPRNMEDFITWTNASAIRQHIANYNDERDDFDLMN